MRLVKLVSFGLLVVGLGLVWSNRGSVIDAYRTGRSTEAVRLSGVDLAYEVGDVGPSPYTIPLAPDTASGPRSVRFDPAPPGRAPVPTIDGGSARLQGTVVGPDGPVDGAVVRVERHTAGGVATVDVTTDADGEWRLGRVAGGRYRVRAWLPGALTMGRSEVRWVADEQRAPFEFSLWGIDPSPRFELVTGGPLYEGGTGMVALVLGWRSIDEDGLVVTNPWVGAGVMVETTAQVEVLSPQPVPTDGSGTAWVELRCIAPDRTAEPDPGSDDPAGPAPAPEPIPAAEPVRAGAAGTLTARSGAVAATFDLPGCQPAPEPDPVPVAEPPIGSPSPSEPSPEPADG